MIKINEHNKSGNFPLLLCSFIITSKEVLFPSICFASKKNKENWLFIIRYGFLHALQNAKLIKYVQNGKYWVLLKYWIHFSHQTVELNSIVTSTAWKLGGWRARKQPHSVRFNTGSESLTLNYRTLLWKPNCLGQQMVVSSKLLNCRWLPVSCQSRLCSLSWLVSARNPGNGDTLWDKSTKAHRESW